jgi:peptidoglycan/LPS O-acetylase OafA/YrhL
MKITYRPEIDGLRSLAVGAVIIYHSQIKINNSQIFEGGFLGVDIFFVISGYLISSIILRELFKTDTFSFKYFYEKRIRRILPALLFVMLVSIPFAWLYLLPSDLEDFSKSILYSLGFGSNFYFHFSGLQYGDIDGLSKPFLHTWSLSVEEQFYILFPIFLFFTFLYFRKFLIYVVIFGFIFSLGLAEWVGEKNSSLNFYILPSRIWELLAGTILAYLEIAKGRQFQQTNINSFFTITGIFLILLSFYFFNDEVSHPSFYTLLPIVGTCLIIWYSNKDEIITKILSSKIFVQIGLISYSLYLWHYPIFAFARVNEFTQGSIIKKLSLGLLVLLISTISYYFVEKPFRNKNVKFNSILIGFLLSIIILTISSFYIINKNGKVNKLNIIVEETISSPLFESDCKFSTDQPNFLSEKLFINKFNECKKNYKKFILILGDSHSVDIFNSFSKISKEKKFIVGLNKGGCRPLENLKKCHYLDALKFIETYSNDIEYIFFTLKGSYFLTNTGKKKDRGNSKFRKLPLNEMQIKNTIKYLNQIKELKNEIIFIGPHLEPNIFLNRRNVTKILKSKNIQDETNYDLIKVDFELKEISKKNEITYVSKIDTIKFDIKKDFLINSNITFSDTDHWSDFGEIYLGKKLINNSLIKDIIF